MVNDILSLESGLKFVKDLEELLKHPLNKLVIKEDDYIYLINKRYRVCYSLNKKNLDVLFMATLTWFSKQGFSLVIGSDPHNLFKYEGYLTSDKFPSICKAKSNHPLFLIIESYLAILEYMAEANEIPTSK